MFVISNIVYRAFYAIELSLRPKMISHSFDKETLLKNVVEDETIQFYWAQKPGKMLLSTNANYLRVFYSSCAAYMEEGKERRTMKIIYTDD